MTHQNIATAPDGTAISWSRIGAGDPVVLVHGITESAASFEPVAQRLAASHEVITLDLRGHGESGKADTYDLAAMASDVLAVVAVAGVESPHLVGHSLGGAVVTATGASGTVASVIDIDQSMQLGAFKDQLIGAEAMLRDSEQYTLVLDAMFEMMGGELLPSEERQRLDELRRADQDVVLGVWDMLLTQPVEEIAATVDAALAPYGTSSVPYLALFGLDPGDDYAEWLAQRIPTSVVEFWPEYGHYPHLVDPDRFVERANSFWQ
jgi:pimeloyl-ACP methyl ester carboxylesterase